jgi:uncharacterized protein
MINRINEKRILQELIGIFPVTAILGARQVGKSTLAKQIEHDWYFDLENPSDLLQFDNPKFLLEPLKGLIVIDEIQRKPELFPLLRFLVDNNPGQKFLLLGSASPDLIKGSGETLAGRIGYHFLGGFTIEETGNDYQGLWLRGTLPKPYLLEESESFMWRDNFITTFLERDIPQLGINIPSNTLRRFWTMLAHYNGQLLNYSELARSFGISDMTIRRYLEILEGTFMIRLLTPWYSNLGKRLVKSPKLYFRDTGILHNLLTVSNQHELLSHPKLGASWEGFCIENAIRALNRSAKKDVWFYSTHSGSEVDLFWQKGGRNYAIEVKFSDTPRITRSLSTAIKDLDIDRAWIVYPGEKIIPLSETIDAIPVSKLDSVTGS